jgi:hypothetical protein
VNLEALNRYVLAVILLFAVFLYIAMVFTGFRELISRMPKSRTRRKRSRNRSTSRR